MQAGAGAAQTAPLSPGRQRYPMQSCRLPLLKRVLLPPLPGIKLLATSAAAYSIADRLQVLLTPLQTAEELLSLTPPARVLLQAGRAFGVQGVEVQVLGQAHSSRRLPLPLLPAGPGAGPGPIPWCRHRAVERVCLF